MMGNVLIIVALIVVVVILMAGLVAMSIGGEVGEKWSNRLMRYRVLAQAVAICIILLVIYASSQH
jgi:tryptophan-rich sensory protein